MRKNMIWVIIYKTDENSNCRQNKGQDNFFYPAEPEVCTKT